MSSTCSFGTMFFKTSSSVRVVDVCGRSPQWAQEPSDEFDPGLALAADQHFDAKGWLEVLR